MKKITERAIVVIIGLVFCAVLLEGILRVVGFTFLSIQEYRNRLSLSKRETYKILCLGDSMTANQYPEYLERVLNRRTPEVEFTVIDKGMPGANLEYILENLERNLIKYTPDMVIAMVNFSYNSEEDILEYEDILVPETVQLKEIKYFIKRLKTYKLIKILWLLVADKANLYGEAINIVTGERKTYIELGDEYWNNDNFEMAEGMYKKAIEVNPDNYTAYLRLGSLYFGAETDKSIKLYRVVVEKGSVEQKKDAYLGLADVYVELGEESKVVKMYQEAIKIDENASLPYIKLGWYYESVGRYYDAKAVVEKTIEIFPWDEIVLRNYAMVCLQEGKYEIAKRYFDKAESIEFENYKPNIYHRYHKLKDIITQKGIKLVCMQYPVQSITPLNKLFEGHDNIIFVDNEEVFKERIKRDNYEEYFMDRWGGDFGHFTEKGNWLMSRNIADTLFLKAFRKQKKFL